MFNLYRKFKRPIDKVLQILIINTLILLTCLPFITFGASQSASFYILTKNDSVENSTVDLYINRVKLYLKKSIQITLIQIIFIYLLLVYWRYQFVVYKNINIFMVGGFIVTFTGVGFFQYIYYFIGNEIGTFKEQIKTSIFLTLLYPINTLLLIIIDAVTLIGIFLNPYLASLSIYLLIFGSYGLSIYIRTILISKIIEKINIKKKKLLV